MENFIKVLLILHIAAGTVALFSGPVAMIVKKGSIQHRIWGKFYFWGMSIITITAIIISIYKYIPFLLMVAIFSYHSIVVAYRALYLKKMHLGEKAKSIDWITTGIASIFDLGLMAWGANEYFINKNDFGLVAIIFSAIGLFFCYRNVRKYLAPSIDKNQWLYDHIRGMIGGYIATVTAFMAVNVHFLPPVLVWLFPTVIGSPAIYFWIRYYKQKFNQGQPANELVTVKIEA